jgi:hypothetical protein
MTDPLDLALADRLEGIRRLADEETYLWGRDWDWHDSALLDHIIDHLRGANDG